MNLPPVPPRQPDLALVGYLEEGPKQPKERTMSLNTGTPGVPAAAAALAAALTVALEDWVAYLLSLVALPDDVAGSTEALALVAVGALVGWVAQRWTWSAKTVEAIGEYSSGDEVLHPPEQTAAATGAPYVGGSPHRAPGWLLQRHGPGEPLEDDE